MKKSKALRAKELIEELEELIDCQKIYNISKHPMHFAVHKHFNPQSDLGYCDIPCNLNNRLSRIIDSRITEVEEELDGL